MPPIGLLLPGEFIVMVLANVVNFRNRSDTVVIFYYGVNSTGAQAMKAIWNNTLIAESNETVKLEGNYYFPPDSVKTQFLRESNTHTLCSWKGKANYYDIVVDDSINRDAAWYYPEPKQEALNIKNHVAFWHGVEVIQ
jgi:uncharacterized protein (DUF427 family)